MNALGFYVEVLTSHYGFYVFPEYPISDRGYQQSDYFHC